MSSSLYAGRIAYRFKHLHSESLPLIGVQQMRADQSRESRSHNGHALLSLHFVV
jgi:hypothetical protein